MERFEKINLVETPDSWDDIVKFCERASTPSDATIAAMMTWNLAVELFAMSCETKSEGVSNDND